MQQIKVLKEKTKAHWLRWQYLYISLLFLLFIVVGYWIASDGFAYPIPPMM